MIRSNCQSTRHMLFAYLEGEVTVEERAQIDEHLLVCELCGEQLNAERKLTSLIDEAGVREALSKPTPTPLRRRMSRRPRRAVVYKSMLAIAGLILLTATVYWSAQNTPDQTPLSLGSLTSQRLVIGTSRALAQEQELRPSNSIRLPNGSSARIALTGGGEIAAVGPAEFELDLVDERWKITLIRGQLSITVHEGQPIAVATRSDSKTISSGFHIVDSTTGWVDSSSSTNTLQHRWLEAIKDGIESDVIQNELEQRDDLSPAELLERGFREFYATIGVGSSSTSDNPMSAAADFLKQAMDHPDATADQKSQAMFYLAAALGNAKRHDEALEVARAWISDESKEPSDVIMSIYADACWFLGRHEEARDMWRRLLEEFPDSVYKVYFEERLRSEQGTEKNRAEHGDDRVRNSEANEGQQTSQQSSNPNGGPYLVVAVSLPDAAADPDSPYAGFRSIAEEIARFHKSDIIDFDGQDFAALKTLLRTHQPQNVLFVVTPDRLEVNLHRQILMLAPQIDNDPFVDFSFGYFTAKDTEDLKSFWDRTVVLHRNGLPNRNWVNTSVVGSGLKSSRTSSPSGIAAGAGFRGESLRFGIVDADPDVLDFVTENLSALESASVISMTGNGDPQGIWLFDGMRNMQKDAHWEFDPSRVGSDPEGVMPRITADRFRALKLNGPLIWSGTCHSGAANRVFVEGDIVSTFGFSEQVEVYDLPPEESLCLSMIEAGAGALLVPIASNHGYSTLNESMFAIRYGASLGEIIKSTYDDICLQANGAPRLVIVEQGEKHHFGAEPVMQGGGANRILIGDPSLTFFEPTEVSGESVEVVANEGENLEIAIEWEDGFHPWGWNIYSESRQQEIRVFARVPWPAELPVPTNDSLSATVDVINGDAKQIDHEAKVVLEDWHGKTYLHLQAATTDSSVHYKARTASFRVTWPSK